MTTRTMMPQDHASHLLYVWQSRRHLKPAYRLVDQGADSHDQVVCNDSRRAALAEKDS